MSTPIRIRDAVPNDLDFLVDSNAAMALETEHRQLDRATLEAGVAGVFAEGRRGFYLVAERDGAAAGCLLVTREWSDWRNGEWWWLQSVYVAPAARRGGMFRALHGEVARRAAAAPGVVGLRLYVEGGNRRAQETYRALGMEEAVYRLFEQPLARGPAT